MRSKKAAATVLAVIFAIALITSLFFMTMHTVIYGNMPQNFVRECVKYNVLDEVGISEEELAATADDMFEYLRGGRESLADIKATIHGQPDTPFFNEKECLHMADCRKLFLAGYAIWRWSAVIAAAALLIILIMFRRTIGDALHCLAVGVLAGAGIMTAVTGILAILVSRDFYKYFTLFHEIFFDNDLWILDPSADRLLMIMPTGYFVDCVRQIGLIFGISVVVLLILAVLRLVFEGRNARKFKAQ